MMLARVVGFALGAAMLGYAAFGIGLLFLSFVPGGIHSDLTSVLLFGVVFCFVLGGVVGATIAVHLVESWRG